MKKSLGIVLALFLMAALSVPAMGATLSVSGKYVAEIDYANGVITSVNAVDATPGVELLEMSTLYLNLDFTVGDTMSAHIPLRLYKAIELEVDQNPDDNYQFVFKGAPLTLSLTDAEDGDYFFSAFGDPLGLVATIDTDAYEYATFKAAGQPFGIGFTGYLMATDPAGDTYPRFAAARATYPLSSGHTIGAIYATERDPGAIGLDPDHDGDTDRSVDQIANFEVDAAGPLYITEGATFTTALALSKTQDAGTWSEPANAFELNLAGINMGGVTLSGNVRAVSDDFVGIANFVDEDNSDVDNFHNIRQLQGEATTNVNLAGQAAKLTVGDDYRVAYNGTVDESSTNKVYGSVEVKPSEPVTLTVGGYYQNWLIAEGAKADDYKGNVYGTVKYAPSDALELNGGAQWMTAESVDTAGTGIKLDGSATVKPAAGVQIVGSVDYQLGKYDFIDDGTIEAADATRLDGEVYGEVKQTFVTAGVKQVDTVLAGLARGVFLSSPDVKRTYVGYGEANVKISDQFSDKVAVLSGNSDETDGDGHNYAGHYDTVVRNEFAYALSPDSALAIGYTWRDAKSTWDASYTVTLGDATMKLSYGTSGLDDDACTWAFDDGRPWAWLCETAVTGTPNTYKLVVTIPF